MFLHFLLFLSLPPFNFTSSSLSSGSSLPPDKSICLLSLYSPRHARTRPLFCLTTLSSFSATSHHFEHPGGLHHATPISPSPHLQGVQSIDSPNPADYHTVSFTSRPVHVCVCVLEQDVMESILLVDCSSKDIIGWGVGRLKPPPSPSSMGVRWHLI